MDGVNARYAILSFSSAYSFMFLNLLGASLVIPQQSVESVGIAQVIIAFSSSLFQLLAPSRRARSNQLSWVGSTNMYEVVNMLSVIALTYAVTYAFGVTDLIGSTIAIISTYTVYGMITVMNIPNNAPTSVILMLSLLCGLLMMSMDVSLIIIFKLLT